MFRHSLKIWCCIRPTCSAYSQSNKLSSNNKNASLSESNDGDKSGKKMDKSIHVDIERILKEQQEEISLLKAKLAELTEKFMERRRVSKLNMYQCYFIDNYGREAP